jgi:hypothetical protein
VQIVLAARAHARKQHARENRQQRACHVDSQREGGREQRRESAGPTILCNKKCYNSQTKSPNKIPIALLKSF